MAGYINKTGAAGEHAALPDLAAYTPSDTLDVRVLCAADDWTPTGDTTLVAKAPSTNAREWRLDLRPAGTLRVNFNHTSGSELNEVANDSTTALTVSDGALLAVRVLVDFDNGAAGWDTTYYSKTATTQAGLKSNSGWTQLGTVVTTATARTLFDGSAIVEIGTLFGGTIQRFAGNMYGVVVVGDGVVVMDVAFTDLTTAEVTAKAFTEDSSNAATVTLNGTAWTYVRDVSSITNPEDLVDIKDMLGSATDTELLGYLVEAGASANTDLTGALNELNGTTGIGFRKSFDDWLTTVTTTGPGA